MSETMCAFCGDWTEETVLEDLGQVCLDCKRQKTLLEGVTDRVEILKIIHQTERERIPDRAYIPQQTPLYQLFDELNDQEIENLVQFVVAQFPFAKESQFMRLAQCLASFTQGDITRIQELAAHHPMLFPYYVFRNAGTGIIEILVSRSNSLHQGKDREFEGLNVCWALSWMGTDAALSQLIEWRDNPPPWAVESVVRPHDFLDEAGWEFDQHGKRRNLFLERCYPLLPSTDEAALTLLETGKPCEDTCQWCEGPMVRMFEFNLSDPFFDFIPFKGEKLSFVTCEACSMNYETIFMEVGPQGEAVWFSQNCKMDYDELDLDEPKLPAVELEYRMIPNVLRLSLKPRLLHHGLDWHLPSPRSQVGGHASWGHGSDLGPCPKCDQKMIFIAQIAAQEADHHGLKWGTFHALLCPDCSVTLVNYQVR